MLCTAVTEQNLLKTVTQIFAEAEVVRLAIANGYERRFPPDLADSSGESPELPRTLTLKKGSKAGLSNGNECMGHG